MVLGFLLKKHSLVDRRESEREGRRDESMTVRSENRDEGKEKDENCG